MHCIFRNVLDTDFGEYEMTYFRLGKINVKAKFTIYPDPEESSFNTRRVLIIVSVVLGVMILLLLLLWIIFRIEIRWIWHKVCKPHEKGIGVMLLLRIAKYIRYIIVHAGPLIKHMAYN